MKVKRLIEEGGMDKLRRGSGSKSITEHRDRDLFKRSLPLSFTIALFTVFILLFLAATATPASAVVHYDLEGWTRSPHPGWTSGHVAGWAEGECIPFHYLVDNQGADAETLKIRLRFDYKNAYGILGIIRFEDFSIPAEIEGPFYESSLPAEGFYWWNFTIPGNAQYDLTWCARLSPECGDWKGASMQVRASGGDRTVSIDTPDIVYPGIEVVKVCPDPTEYQVGETINYEWRVSNTGDVPLSNIVLTDTGGPCTPVYDSGDVNNDGKLDPGEVWIYKCSYVVRVGDTVFTNTANVEGTDSQGETVYGTSNTCEVKIVYPKIEVVKVCPDPTEYQVGETINYEWRVSNTGDVPLSNIVLTDTGGPCTPVYDSGDVNGDLKLDVNEVWIYKCSYVVRVGDTVFTNTANVEGTDSQGETVYGTSNTCEVKIVYLKIEVVKVCPDPTEYQVGETINYEWRVSNTGDVPLSNIVLTDTGGPCTPVYDSGDVNGDLKLDVNEVWIYKCSYVVRVGDTVFTNTANVEGTDSQGETVYGTSNACEVKIVYPKIEVVKVCPDPTEYQVGETINYEWRVSNTGDVPLSNIVLTDTGGPCTPVYDSGDVNNDGKLDPGEVWIYKCSYVVQRLSHNYPTTNRNYTIVQTSKKTLSF